MTAHALAEELLPAVAILGHGRIGVLLSKSSDVRRGLVFLGVDTCRRCEEETTDVVALGCTQEVGVDEHREHAKGLVVLDETHTTHVRSKVEHVTRALQCHGACRRILQVGDHYLGAFLELVPLGAWLPVNRSDVLARGEQVSHEMTADESAGSSNNGDHQRKVLDALSERHQFVASASRGRRPPQGLCGASH